MPRIEWDETFSVDHQDIDQQHQHWIDIFNRLHDNVLSGKHADAAARALEEIDAYTHYHFEFEEEVLRQLDYPDLVAHRRLHKDFRNRIHQYLREHQQGQLILNSKILKEIRSWLLEHILSEDQKYRSHTGAKNH